MNQLTQIDTGDIATVMESIYIDFPGGKWADHFVNARKHYIALDFPSNNGNFRGRDKNGIMKWLYVPDVIDVKKRG